MSITRSTHRSNGYLVLTNRIAEDQRLSWAARGLLVYLLSKPDNWQVQTNDLINATAKSARSSGRDAVQGLIKELIALGYIRRSMTRGSFGKFASYTYEIIEDPFERENENDDDEQGPGKSEGRRAAAGKAETAGTVKQRPDKGRTTSDKQAGNSEGTYSQLVSRAKAKAAQCLKHVLCESPRPDVPAYLQVDDDTLLDAFIAGPGEPVMHLPELAEPFPASPSVNKYLKETNTETYQVRTRESARENSPPRANTNSPRINKTFLPNDFKPTGEHRTTALKRGIDLAYVWLKFKDYHRAHATRFADWSAALMLWLLNEKVDQRYDRSIPPPHRKIDYVSEARDYFAKRGIPWKVV